MRASFRNVFCLGVAGAVAVTAGIVSAGCQQQPIEVPIQSLERSQRADVVCLRITKQRSDQSGKADQVAAEPAPEVQCAPLRENGTKAEADALEYHLFALVTQSARGELAVIDLSAQRPVDVDVTTPGVNFLPVGSLPTDVAVAPDGKMAFVAAAETNKPAIYALNTRYILGNYQTGLKYAGNPLEPSLAPPAPRLTQWPACSLPQAPGAMLIVPLDGAKDAGDGGASAGSEGGAGDATNASPGYVIVAVLPGGPGESSKLVTIDPSPLLRGGEVLQDGSGDRIEPGSLAPCPILKGVELSDAVPTSATVGSTWPDGVPYVDGGVDLSSSYGPPSPSCGGPVPDPAGGYVGVGDAGAGDAGDAGAPPAPPPTTDGGPVRDELGHRPGDPIPVVSGPRVAPRGGDAVRRGTYVYVADETLPLIHLFDVSDPSHPREAEPLYATSVDEPERSVAVGGLAVSPPTRDYKYYLYAIDRRAGSLMVFDVTDPERSPRGPLTRPHPELTPFQPVDRLTFGAPVAAMEFVVYDWPIQTDDSGDLVATYSGFLCNPNPNAGGGGRPVRDPGVYYRLNYAKTRARETLSPSRLRGVFAFATLTTGQIAIVDVDDWDSPCRRPDPMTPTYQTSAMAVPQPQASGIDDLDPYHAPQTYEGAGTSAVLTVSQEPFFPMSAPHRLRSGLRPGATTLIPYLGARPVLSLRGASLSTTGEKAASQPTLLPPRTAFLDPNLVADPRQPVPEARGELVSRTPQEEQAGVTVSNASVVVVPGAANPSVRFNYEDPTVQQDQDWAVTYEGVLPGVPFVPGTLSTNDGFRTLEVRSETSQFCRAQVEDYRMGRERALAAKSALATLRRSVPSLPDMEHIEYRVADYVQIVDTLLPITDPYWRATGPEADACWGDLPVQSGDDRFNFCLDTFGAAADESPRRDFPILEAYENRLVLGTYAYRSEGTLAPSSTTRYVFDGVNVPPGEPPPDASVSRRYLKFAQCCFHAQAKYRVRAGGEWLLQGSRTGYLGRVTTDPTTKACVESCRPEARLLNSRSLEVPRPTGPVPPEALVAAWPDRTSPLALRNPMFSFITWGGAPPTGGAFTTTQRDTLWTFSTRGGFAAYTLAIGNSAQAAASSSPQSMRFVNSLGQLMVVDGASQGLTLISIQSVAARAPFL